MKRKTILAVVALSALSFNAAAWQMHNGWCQQLSDDGQVLMMVKANRAAIFGQKGCRESYFGKGENFGVNGDVFASVGTCNQQTGHNPISVADNAQSASAVAHSIAGREQGVIQAFGGSMPISRNNFVEVCSAVIPALKSVNSQAAAAPDTLESVSSVAHGLYSNTYGVSALMAAKFGPVLETASVYQGDELIRVYQYEVTNPTYNQYDVVIVYVDSDGGVVDAQIHQGR